MSDNFDDWFAVSVDVLLHPSFPADELEKLKQRQRVQLREQRIVAGFLLSERFNRAVYGDHPAAQVSASAESIDALKRETLGPMASRRATRRKTRSSGSPATCAPKISSQNWRNVWPAGKKPSLQPTWPRNPVPANSAQSISWSTGQTRCRPRVALGNIAIDRRSPDYMAMVVMNHVIGGGASARLFLNLREEKGYTYGVYSDFCALRYPGPWRAGGNMRTEVTEGALVEFFNEIRRIRDEKCPTRGIGSEQAFDRRAASRSLWNSRSRC